MPWCQKCKVEYREGFTVCSDCGSELVAELLDTTDDTDETQTCELDSDHEALLATVYDLREAEIIASLLEQNGIPVMLKQRGAGEFMMILGNFNFFDIEIYVPSSLLETARALLKQD